MVDHVNHVSVSSKAKTPSHGAKSLVSGRIEPCLLPMFSVARGHQEFEKTMRVPGMFVSSALASRTAWPLAFEMVTPAEP
jgi:hypothetical protein